MGLPSACLTPSLCPPPAEQVTPFHSRRCVCSTKGPRPSCSPLCPQHKAQPWASMEPSGNMARHQGKGNESLAMAARSFARRGLGFCGPGRDSDCVDAEPRHSPEEEEEREDEAVASCSDAIPPAVRHACTVLSGQCRACSSTRLHTCQE